MRHLILSALAVALVLSTATARATTMPTVKTVDVGNGVRLHYVELGHGIPVVFVHGSLSDGRYWNDQIGEFAKHYRVIAYSRRYNFPNVNPSRPGYSAITDADDLSALIERLHLGRVYVVGHSYGALTALFLSAGLDQPQQTVETLSLPVVTSLLSQSDMVSAMPDELVKPYLAAGLLEVLPFDLGLRMDVYGIVTRRGHQLSPGAELMLACLREQAAQRPAR